MLPRLTEKIVRMGPDLEEDGPLVGMEHRALVEDTIANVGEPSADSTHIEESGNESVQPQPSGRACWSTIFRGKSQQNQAGTSTSNGNAARHLEFSTARADESTTGPLRLFMDESDDEDHTFVIPKILGRPSVAHASSIKKPNPASRTSFVKKTAAVADNPVKNATPLADKSVKEQPAVSSTVKKLMPPNPRQALKANNDIDAQKPAKKPGNFEITFDFEISDDDMDIFPPINTPAAKVANGTLNAKEGLVESANPASAIKSSLPDSVAKKPAQKRINESGTEKSAVESAGKNVPTAALKGASCKTVKSAAKARTANNVANAIDAPSSSKEGVSQVATVHTIAVGRRVSRSNTSTASPSRQNENASLPPSRLENGKSKSWNVEVGCMSDAEASHMASGSEDETETYEPLTQKKVTIHVDNRKRLVPAEQDSTSEEEQNVKKVRYRKTPKKKPKLAAPSALSDSEWETESTELVEPQLPSQKREKLRKPLNELQVVKRNSTTPNSILLNKRNAAKKKVQLPPTDLPLKKRGRKPGSKTGQPAAEIATNAAGSSSARKRGRRSSNQPNKSVTDVEEEVVITPPPKRRGRTRSSLTDESVNEQESVVTPGPSKRGRKPGSGKKIVVAKKPSAAKKGRGRPAARKSSTEQEFNSSSGVESMVSMGKRTPAGRGKKRGQGQRSQDGDQDNCDSRWNSTMRVYDKATKREVTFKHVQHVAEPSFQSYPGEPVDDESPLSARKVFGMDDIAKLRIMQMRIPAMQKKSTSYCDEETLICSMLSGSLKLLMNEKEVICHTGDTFFVPPQNLYSLANESSVDAVVQFIRCSGSLDYLSK